MTALVKYEAARAALQAAHDVDEVKDIRDKAQAMAAYAKQANDTALVEWATEIKVRAERKAGEMLASMKANGSRANAADNLKTGPKSPDGISGPTLDSLGISPNQASRWQKLADIPQDKFEQAVAAAKEVAGEVTTAALLRAARPPQDIPRPEHEVNPAGTRRNLDQQTNAKIASIQQLHKAEAALKAEREAHAETKDQLTTIAETARELEDKLTMYEAKEPDEQQKVIAQLQKKVLRLEAEIERLTRARNDCQNKNNELIREVRRLRKKG